MKTVKYNCNLCREEREKKDLYSFYFKSDKLPQQYSLDGSLDLSDNHICQSCIDVIINSFN